MRSFTKMLLVMMAIMLSSSIVFSQGKMAGWQLEELKDNPTAFLDDGSQQKPTEVVPPSTGSRATGDDCSDPIIVNLPGDLPYADYGQTNCGRGNNYSTTTCLGLYDGGDDIIYQLNVSSNVILDITMDPLGTTYAGIAVFDGCPDLNVCLYSATNSSSSSPMMLTEVNLAPGTYYFMVDTWPSPACIPNFNLDIVEWVPPPPPPFPITTFPFMADFEDGLIPAEMENFSAVNADVYPDMTEPYDGSYNGSYSPTTSAGWLSPYGTGPDAFNSSPTHHAVTRSLIVPDGTAAPMMLEFMMKQNYTYNPDYNWMRVRVDGMVIQDINGIDYHQPTTNNGDPYQMMAYDLSAYTGAPFILSIETCGKYNAGSVGSYPWGDVTYIDDLAIYYVQDPGGLEGYVFNYDGLAISGATVALDEDVFAISGPDGYYTITDVPYGMQEFLAGKEGYNTTVAMLDIPSGGILTYDWTLTQPNMVVTPLSVIETLNPDEFYSFTMSVLNNGNGPLDWEAQINYLSETSGPMNGISLDDMFALVTPKPAQAQGDPTGKAPFVVDPANYPFPILSGRDDDTESYGYGAFPGNNTVSFILNNPGVMVNTGAVASNFIAGADINGDGEYYGCVYGGQWVHIADPANPVINVIGSCPDFSGVAYDYSTDTWYGCTFTGSTLYTIDPATGTSTQIGGSGSDGCIAIACDGSGQLYGINLFNDALESIDAATGAWTNIGPLGVDVNYAQDMAFDRATNTLYWAGYTLTFNTGQLYTIDVTTGAPTLIGGFMNGEEVTGFGIPGGGGGGAGSWLSMDYYEGSVDPFGGVDNIPTHMDATGASAGEVYNAEIVFSSMPNVGTITVPVTMIIAGDPLIPADNLEVELTSDITGEVSMTWTWEGPGTATFQYFLVKRNGAVIGTTTNMMYMDMLPDYGDYCYTVEAVYAEGSTAPAGPECIEWPLPELFVDPDNLEAWVWPNHQVTVTTTISNLGIGTLAFTFPEWVDNSDFTCTHQVALYDTFGDGWNGATLDVFVNGSAVLTGITLASGGGPEYFDFLAFQGDEITTTYNVNGNPWPFENSYEIIDGFGDVIFLDPPTPVGIGPGQCFANCPVPGFVVDVVPAFGFIGEGASQDVIITYDATDFPAGSYMEDLMLESNDPNNLEYTINNTMHVYIPAHYTGNVMDNNTSLGLPGVEVSAGMWTTLTDENGDYTLFVDEGTYDVFFDKLGYQTVVVADTFAQAGVATPIDVGMWDVAYPPAGVIATVQDDDTWCLVEWLLPEGPYELQMDDGSAEDFAVWAAGGSQNAVKFTPNGYPATIIGGRFFVGDGSFPGPFLNSEFSVVVYDDDGTDGMPGTMLDSAGVTVNNYGWVDVDWLGAMIMDGDFYLAMWQTGNSPNVAPIGIDTELPTYYKSYSKFQENDWTVSAYQDFMIRAWISGPQSDASDNASVAEMVYPAKPLGYGEHWYNASEELPMVYPGVEKEARTRSIEGMVSRDVVNYRVARLSNFDPNGPPELGDVDELATTGNLFYEDYAWAGLPQGWYAYAVRASYTSGEWSDWAISNIVGHLMDFEVTVNVTLTTGDDPVNVEITMQGLDYPYETYFDVTPVSGTVVFPEVWKGTYALTAFKIGFDLYEIDDVVINADTEINIVLQETKYKPTNLYVDPLTLEATWNEPFVTTLMENFEDPAFPPAGWQSLTDGAGWFRTDDGSSGNWPVPSWDSFYACVNDDDAGSNNPGANDYLITPPMDLRVSDGFVLSFDSYYDGAFGQLAGVEYTTDGGATWDILFQLTPAAGSWQMIELDLAAFSGANAGPQIWFAFHSDDAGQWASGWAVDNPTVQVPDPAANYIDFHVFLDGAFVGATEETNWNYAPLTYGVEYEASVAARYTSGLSEKDYYTFLCVYLIPPRNLQGIAPDDAAILIWEPPLTPGGDYFTVVSDEPRTEFPNVNSEYSPRVRQIEGGTANRDPWDLQFAWATADNSGEAGAETDGDFYYTTMWNGSGFQQYDLDGTYIGPLSAGGVGSIRDLAWDPTTEHMFGGAASPTVNEMDLQGGTLIGTFSAPTDVRAIAYDEGFDGFWANNWSSTITLFDKTGAQLNSFPVGSFGSYYGFAYDDWTDGGPFLWGFSQDGSGNVIVQMEIATGTETGFTQDVSGILTAGSGTAGGLFTHCGVFADGKVTIGGNSQNDTFFGYELEDCTNGGGGGGEVPANLLGYNIYRDGDFVDYVVRDFLTYVDEGLQPAIYQYTITGVYDLTPYGFPGETGESMEEGPAQVVVDYCFDLEFMEDWGFGNFETNGWDNTGNWGINGQTGNPAPAAEFTWDPIQTEYEWSLTTFPLCAQGITEGDIWLEFDLRLDDVAATGEEYLMVDMWNWDSQDWMTIATFSNADGDIPWDTYQYKINSAKEKVFKIRFKAMGMNSLDILGWYVDNVYIYRTCEAPTDLAATEFGADFDDILLTWEAAGGLIDEWIHWDDGMNAGNSIGTGAAAEFDAAARWEPAQLVEYEGTEITEIAFFPAEAAATYNVRVWVGAGAANLVVDQNVAAPLIGQWNYITLDTPVALDISQELWVGYYVNTTTGYPAGVDAGPAIDGYGNMMNFGGWQTLLQINPDLDFNWNIQARLQSANDDNVVLPSPIAQETYAQPEEILTSNPNATTTQSVFGAGSGVRVLTGFNIYRSDDGGDYEFLTFKEDDGVREYVDEDLTAGVIYCYMITSVYESDIDFCESDYSDEACAYVTVGVDELSQGSFSLYPNPATDYTRIESSSELQRITVYSSTGKLMFDETVNGIQYELKTSVYTPGAYLIRVESAEGVTTQLLNVQR